MGHKNEKYNEKIQASLEVLEKEMLARTRFKLLVREMPMASSEKIATVEYDTLVTVLRTCSQPGVSWLEIQTPTGVIGYIRRSWMGVERLRFTE